MGTGFCVNASFHFSRMNAPKCNFWSYGCYITFKETVNLFSGWLCHLLLHQQWMSDPVSSPFHQYLVVSLCFISVVLTVIPNERLLTVVPICIHPMTNDVESSASLLRSFRCCLYVLDSHPLLDWFAYTFSQSSACIFIPLTGSSQSIRFFVFVFSRWSSSVYQFALLRITLLPSSPGSLVVSTGAAGVRLTGPAAQMKVLAPFWAPLTHPGQSVRALCPPCEAGAVFFFCCVGWSRAIIA